MDELLVQKKSFELALSMIRLYKKLQARQEVVLSNQLLKCGTRIGVKIEEAVAGPASDFAAQIAAAVSQARTTRYWLRLLQESRLVDIDVTGELNQVDELLTLLTDLTH